MRTPGEIRQEIEALEASMEDIWSTYKEILDLGTQLLDRYKVESQTLGKLYAEEHHTLTKERGN